VFLFCSVCAAVRTYPAYLRRSPVRGVSICRCLRWYEVNVQSSRNAGLASHQPLLFVCSDAAMRSREADCLHSGWSAAALRHGEVSQQAKHPCAPAHARDRITSPLQPPNARVLLQALLGQYQPVLASTSQPHFTPQCQ
jgi:hypothetical protein